MARATTELERTFDLPAADTALPDLTGCGEVVAVRRLDDEQLEATYHDTADLRLVAARATLRRRTGGRDAGWHLKLPAAGGARTELQLPLRAGPRGAVPAELLALTRSRRRGAELQPVVRLRTSRQVLQLLDAADRVLAEVADDRVEAEVLLAPPATSRWREVEVELVDGDEAVLDAVGLALHAAGARPAGPASKLARALGERVPEPPVGGSTAGAAVLAYLREKRDELVAADPLVRRDEHDAVHRMRVATRRLRSLLRTSRPLLDRAATDPLRAELKHLAGVLGQARDAEVLRDRLAAQVAALPAELVLGPVAERIATSLGGRYRTGHAAVVRELDGERYLALLDSLEALLAAPPLTDRASRPAHTELPRLVAREWRRLAAVRDAAVATEGEQRTELLHEVRKAAKAARYAAEAVAPVVGKDAARFAARAEAVQEVLGELQDGAVAGAALRELGAVAHLSGENGFTFGLLHGRQSARGERALEHWEDAWRALSRRPVLAWLT